jgi:antitoxin (DNA-binding transcriptional repressor) of toxin-antitoxin stability system
LEVMGIVACEVRGLVDVIMKFTILATDLARRLGDILGRIRYRGDVFTVERNGTPVASIGPIPGARAATLREAAAAWIAGGAEEGFAVDLARVEDADSAAADPWAS